MTNRTRGSTFSSSATSNPQNLMFTKSTQFSVWYAFYSFISPAYINNVTCNINSSIHLISLIENTFHQPALEYFKRMANLTSRLRNNHFHFWLKVEKFPQKNAIIYFWKFTKSIKFHYYTLYFTCTCIYMQSWKISSIYKSLHVFFNMRKQNEDYIHVSILSSIVCEIVFTHVYTCVHVTMRVSQKFHRMN